jgi:hypothetical protein
MDDWNEIVDITEALDAYDDIETRLVDVAMMIKEKFKESNLAGNERLQLVLGSLEEAADLDDLAYFEEALDDLYDWADEERVCLNTAQ